MQLLEVDSSFNKGPPLPFGYVVDLKILAKMWVLIPLGTLNYLIWEVVVGFNSAGKLYISSYCITLIIFYHFKT
jgi:hypothetical protein